MKTYLAIWVSEVAFLISFQAEVGAGAVVHKEVLIFGLRYPFPLRMLIMESKRRSEYPGPRTAQYAVVLVPDQGLNLKHAVPAVEVVRSTGPSVHLLAIS